MNSLVPTSFTSISRDLDLPPIPLQSPAQVIERSDKSADVGLFSAFTSYVSSVMNDEPPEPNDQEIEATLCTVDCINECHFEQILGNVSELPVESLKSLTISLLSHLPEQDSPRVIAVKPELPAPQPVRANGTKSNSETPLYNPAVVYVLELATILALRDEETITALGADVAQALQTVIRDADRLHPVALSRCVFYLLSLLRASNDHGYIRAPVVLHSISSFRQDILKQCAQPILKGLYGCTSGPAELKKEMATSPDFWSVLQLLMQPGSDVQPDAASLVFQIAEHVADGQNPAITPDNYDACVALLNAFATAGSVGARSEQKRDREQAQARRGGAQQKQQQKESTPDSKKQQQQQQKKKDAAVVRGTRAIAIVSQLAGRVPSLIKQSHLETDQAWRTYWSPIFRCLANQCVNPCREIRHQAFTSLQRCLLSPELAPPDHTEWTNIFGEVLFPLINNLLRPEVYQTDPAGMSETRVQAAQLLCKIFLLYLAEWEGMVDLWVKILGVMDRLMNSGQGGDMLTEAVPESLKNILLVMSGDGYLVAPPSKGAKDERTELQVVLWRETEEKLGRFLPELMVEVFPERPAAPEKAADATPPQAESKSQKEEEAEGGKEGEQDEGEEKESEVD